MVFFDPVKPELGVIPSEQENYSRVNIEIFLVKSSMQQPLQSNYFIQKNQQTSHIRIMNLFPSCYAFLKNSKTRKKFNRTSSDILDKINQKRHRKEGRRG